MSDFVKKIKPVFEKIKKLLSPLKNFYTKHTDILKPVIVLTVICIAAAAALALTNSLTKGKIEAINLENKKREMEALLPADTYTQQSVPDYDNINNFSLYKAEQNGAVVGYIITTSAKGYGGNIVVMTAFAPTRSVVGISILSADDETPGLGQNVKKESFYSQYSRLTGKAVIVKNSADNSNGEINAITGATVSSKAVTTAVNTAEDALNSYLNAILTAVTQEPEDNNIQSETVPEVSDGGTESEFK